MKGYHHVTGKSPEPTQESSSATRLRALRQVLFGKAFAGFWVCLAAAVALALASGDASRATRISNLDLQQSGFVPSYLMTSKREPNRGYLVDRRDSTVRRSRKNLPGKMWDLDRFGEDPAAGLPEHFLLRSKRYGTVFLIPVEAVDDFEYPFVYEFVRAEYPELDLPEAYWTDLYLNRIYHGLYLRMSLPFDLRKKDGGNGVMRELMMVHGNEMTLVDTRFDPDARFYAEGTTLGIFPALKQPPAVLAWLASRCSTPHTTVLLNNVEPHEVRLLPLPYSLERLYERLRRTPLRVTLDERFRRWMTPASEYDDQDAPPFDAERKQRFETQHADYLQRFRAAVEAHRTLRPETVLNAEALTENKAMDTVREGAWRR